MQPGSLPRSVSSRLSDSARPLPKRLVLLKSRKNFTTSPLLPTTSATHAVTRFQEGDGSARQSELNRPTPNRALFRWSRSKSSHLPACFVFPEARPGRWKSTSSLAGAFLLPLDQFNAAVFRSPVFRPIGRDRRIETTAEGVQTVRGYPVLAGEFPYDAGGTSTTQIQIVVRFPLVIRMPHDVQAQRGLALQQLCDFSQGGLRFRFNHV